MLVAWPSGFCARCRERAGRQQRRRPRRSPRYARASRARAARTSVSQSSASVGRTSSMKSWTAAESTYFRERGRQMQLAQHDRHVQIEIGDGRPPSGRAADARSTSSSARAAGIGYRGNRRARARTCPMRRSRRCRRRRRDERARRARTATARPPARWRASSAPLGGASRPCRCHQRSRPGDRGRQRRRPAAGRVPRRRQSRRDRRRAARTGSSATG